MFYRFIIILLSITLSFSLSLQAQENVQTGRLEVVTSSTKILGAQAANGFSETLDSDDEIKWSIYVPENYDPSSPPGMVVHMTTQNMAKMPIGWTTALNEKNLIWISLNKAGQLKQNKEMLIAVLSTPYIQEKYKIDRNRVYIVASTDSCYPASAAMEVYPDIFKGIVYSTCEPINWKNNTPQSIEQMKENRYVFVSSNERDIKIAMRRAYKKYTNSGLAKAKYILIPKLFYGKQIDRRKFAQSIDILDNLN
jgi:predicted peptidase|tara:strand:+ start:46304 stop:47059 length:756 start_codon:yes stop_codon:yes gene_type:complete